MGKSLSFKMGDEQEAELLRMRTSLNMNETDFANRLILGASRLSRSELLALFFGVESGQRLPLASTSRAAREPIPVLNRIPAGQLSLAAALEDALGHLEPRGIRGCDGCFALLVDGNSMTSHAWEGGGIRDGDFVVLNPYMEFEDGKIAAVITTDDEHTLKRLYRVGDKILCRPLNSDFPDTWVSVAEIAFIYPVCDVVPKGRAELIQKGRLN